MGKDPEEQFLKAQQLFRAHQFKKSGKKFHNAGMSFLELEDYLHAKSSFLNGANAFIEAQKDEPVLVLLRLASEVSLLTDDYIGANNVYKQTMEIISNLKKSDDRNYNYILFSVLAYFCLFVNGRQNEGLDYLKRMQKKVDSNYFKESNLIQLVTDLTVAHRDKNQKIIDKVRNDINSYRLREEELLLLKKVILIIQSQIRLEPRVELDKKEYTTNELINLTINFDTSPLIKEFEDSFYDFTVTTFEVSKVLIEMSDNLSLNKKPNFPIEISLGENNPINFLLKPHFQMDKPFIGPIHISCVLNNNLIFIYEIDAVEINLTSPLPTLDISIKNLRPPLIGQSFPLEVLIENKSDGEALDVKVEVEFPEFLKVMRGTVEKQIYSLRSNEELKWELNVKPIEAGDYIIEVRVKFKDPDQNDIDQVKQFPFSIKL